MSQTPIKEYKIGIYHESIAGSILLPGGAKVDPQRFAAFLNQNAREGWRVVTIEREMRRAVIFFSTEAMVVVFERDAQ
jgi:hypothetical protein